MEMASELWTWLMKNWPQLVMVVGSVLAAAEVITKMTPTEKDDSFVEKIGKYWSKLTGMFPSNIKKGQ